MDFYKNSLFLLITEVENWDDFVHMSTDPTAVEPHVAPQGPRFYILLLQVKTTGPFLEPIDTRYQRPVFRKCRYLTVPESSRCLP